MVTKLTVADLKRKLLGEVRTLFQRNGSVWKEPILDVLQDLRQSKARAVLFGGTLRSLLVSRIFHGKPGRPRDIDVVVSGIPLACLEEKFADIVARRTRFGGLQLRRGAWQFDLWPVTETWAFKHGESFGPASFSRLPSTTPFNLEAIAVEAWTYGGGQRTLFSGNDQFFEGIINRTVELNCSDNPFPELTVVRAIVMASELGFKIGPRLAGYIRNAATSMSTDIVERVQISHYGTTRIDSRTLYGLIAKVAKWASNGDGCELPAMGQLGLWPGALTGSCPKLSVRVLGGDVSMMRRGQDSQGGVGIGWMTSGLRRTKRTDPGDALWRVNRMEDRKANSDGPLQQHRHDATNPSVQDRLPLQGVAGLVGCLRAAD